MKKIIGLVIILAVLILGSYYAMGFMTERTLTKNVNLMNQTNGLLVEIQNYHRGWFASTAQLKWQVQIPEQVTTNEQGQSSVVPAQAYMMEMPLEIYHGPVVYLPSGVKFGLGYAHTDLKLPQQYAKLFDSVFSSESIKPHIDLNIFVNYFNQSRLHVSIPGFKLVSKEKNQGQLEWSGLKSTFVVNADLSRVSGDTVLAGMKWLKDAFQADWGKAVGRYNLVQSSEGFYTGQLVFSLDSLSMSEHDQRLVEVKNFEVDTSSEVNAGLLNTHLKISLDQFMAHGKTYGPGIFDLSLKNLDAQVLGKMNEQISKTQQGSPQERQQLLLSVVPQLPKLLGKGPLLEISQLSFVLPEGKVDGNLMVSLPTGGHDNPFQMIQKIKGHGKLTVPKIVLETFINEAARHQLAQQPDLAHALSEQMKAHAQPSDENAQDNDGQEADQAVKPASPVDLERQVDILTQKKLSVLISSGLLIKHADEYSIELNLDNGQLTVNGQPFRPEMLKF